MTPTGPVDAQRAISAWRPRLVSARAGAFAKEVVSAAAPVSAVRARSLLWSASRLGAFGESVGLELMAPVLLHPSVIERFVLVGMADTTPVRRRTTRANLNHLARAVVPGLAGPARSPLPRNRAKSPYSSAELDGFLALADAQPTPKAPWSWPS